MSESTLVEHKIEEKIERTTSNINHNHDKVEASTNIDLGALTTYIPQSVVSFILSQEDQPIEVPSSSSYTTCAMFADISGFTALSEQLAAAEGSLKGAETLSIHLNSYFGQLVKILTGQGGDVFKFAGDACIVLWPPSHEDITTIARRAVQTAMDIQFKLHNVQVDKKSNILLSVKLGIGVGEISILHLGGVLNRREYLAGGTPLLQAFAAEHLAEPGQIVLSPETWKLVNSHFQMSQKLNHEYILLKPNFEKSHQLKKVAIKHIEQTYDDFSTKFNHYLKYVCRAVLPFVSVNEEKWASELRRISCMFINLGFDESDLITISDPTRLSRFHDIMVTVQNCVYIYEGTFNKFLLDDKGATVIVIFGLPPLAHEDDAYRCVLSSLMICSSLHEKGLSASCGITTGPAFCGVVGSRGRREYTILGDSVNLSARLMQNAVRRGGGVLCDIDTQIAASHRLTFHSLDNINVKGKSETITIFQPYPKNVLSRDRDVIIDEEKEENKEFYEIMKLWDSIYDESIIIEKQSPLLTHRDSVFDNINELHLDETEEEKNIMKEIHQYQISGYAQQHLLKRASNSQKHKNSLNLHMFSVDGKKSRLFTETELKPHVQEVSVRSDIFFIPLKVPTTNLSCIFEIKTVVINHFMQLSQPHHDIHNVITKSNSLDPDHYQFSFQGYVIPLSEEICLIDCLSTLIGSNIPLEEKIELELLKIKAYPSPPINQTSSSLSARSAILESIRSLYQQHLGSTIVLEGEIGVGKTHVIRRIMLCSPLQFFCTSGHPFASDIPLYPFKDLLYEIGMAAISNNHSENIIDDLLNYFTSLLSSTFSQNEMSPLYQFFQFKEEKNKVEQNALSIQGEKYILDLISLLATLVNHIASSTPFVIVIDDCTKLDHYSWMLCDKMSQFIQDKNMGITLILLTRPVNIIHLGAFEQFPCEYNNIINRSSSTNVFLHGLDDNTIENIIMNTLGGQYQLPTLMIEMVLSRCNGNPLIARELTETLIKEKLISLDIEKNAVKFHPDFIDMVTQCPVPPIVECMIQSHLDRLSHCQRILVKIAAMLGSEFKLDLLFLVYPIPEHNDILKDEILGLLNYNIIRPIETSTKDLNQLSNMICRFSDSFTQMVVTNSMLRTQQDMIVQRITQSCGMDLDPNLAAEKLIMTGYNYILKQRPTEKTLKNKWKHRWCRLTDMSLSFYYEEHNPTLLGICFLDNAHIKHTKEVNRSYCFKLDTQAWIKKGVKSCEPRSFYFSCVNEQKLREWVTMIHLVINTQHGSVMFHKKLMSSGQEVKENLPRIPQKPAILEKKGWIKVQKYKPLVSFRGSGYKTRYVVLNHQGLFLFYQEEDENPHEMIFLRSSGCSHLDTKHFEIQCKYWCKEEQIHDLTRRYTFEILNDDDINDWLNILQYFIYINTYPPNPMASLLRSSQHENENENIDDHDIILEEKSDIEEEDYIFPDWLEKIYKNITHTRIMNVVDDILAQMPSKENFSRKEIEQLLHMIRYIDQQQHQEHVLTVEPSELDINTRKWLRKEFCFGQSVDQLRFTVSDNLGIDDNFENHRKNRVGSIMSNVSLDIIPDLQDKVVQWTFNIFEYDDVHYFSIVDFFFDSYDIPSTYGFSIDVLNKFLRDMSSQYQDNFYHNWVHAIDVTQAMFVFLSSFRASNFFSKMEVFCLLVACVCHDLDHPGYSNLFQINNSTDLSLFYNDNSVLENHHVSCLFRSLKRDNEINIFKNISPADYKMARNIIINAILSTDMQTHFSSLDKFQKLLKNNQIEIHRVHVDNDNNNHNPPLNHDIRSLIINILLHSADISNPCRPWQITKKWGDMLMKETLKQGDLEKSLNLPISPNADRTEYVQSLISLNFIDFIIAPLYASLRDLLPNIQEGLTLLEKNRNTWYQILLNDIQHNPILLGEKVEKWQKRHSSFQKIIKIKTSNFQKRRASEVFIPANSSSNISESPQLVSLSTKVPQKIPETEVIETSSSTSFSDPLSSNPSNPLVSNPNIEN